MKGATWVSLELTLFGPMRAETTDGRTVLPRMRKTRGLLAILGLAAGRPVPRPYIIALLWSQRGRAQANASLRQAIHELRQVLAPAGPSLLRADRNQIALSRNGVRVDVLVLTDLALPVPDILRRISGPLLTDLRGLDPAFDRFLTAEHQRLVGLAATIGDGLFDESHGFDGLPEPHGQHMTIDQPSEGRWRFAMAAGSKSGGPNDPASVIERCHFGFAETARGLAWPPPDARISARCGSDLIPPAYGATRSSPLDIRCAGGEGSGDAPRLAIMPVRTLNRRDGHDLSSGLTAELTTAFARFRWMSCIARPYISVLPCEDQLDRALCRRLQVDYVLDGSVQRSGKMIRIMVVLVDLRTGAEVVWTRRFDRDGDDILSLQEDLAAEIAAQIDLELLLREAKRSKSIRTGAPRSRDLLLRAISGIYRLEGQIFQTAGEMLDDALLIDPGNAAAHAWSAYWHLLQVGQGWAANAGASTMRAMELAQKAVTLDPTDARAMTLAGHIRGFLGKQAHEAKALHERAIALNPNLPLAWCFSGLAHSYLGDDKEAIRRLQYAQRLSPHDPHGFFFDTALIMPFIVRGDYDSALDLGRRAIALNPGFSSAYKVCLSALGHLRRSSEAADIRARLLDLEPGFSVRGAIERSPMVRAGDIERYADGLRRAGLPE